VAHRSSLMPEFASSLPLSGVDGALGQRFRNTPLAAQAHMKTGLIANVRAISGYVQSVSGRQFAVAILHNGNGVQGRDGDRIQNAVLEWVYAQ
ncbi:MAG: D-alanyl-D-alanine carboxypeptidase, partial [Gammaproteobacteria bacterium]